VFLPASTPDLSALLSTTQTKILLPLHLNPAQSKLVFRTENAAKLASEPIEITLGDVTLPLSHINRNKDVPDRSKTLRAIIAKSTTQADWENVLRVMEGYENAGVRMKTGWQEQVVRKLGQAGCQHLVVKALKRAADTGLRLREWGVIREVIRGVRDKAAGAEWAQEDLKKAVNMAEQVVEMMEEDEHLGKAVGAADHRSNPMVVALPLEMAAELAYRHDGDVERVKKYAQRLMTALKQHDFLSVRPPIFSASTSLIHPDRDPKSQRCRPSPRDRLPPPHRPIQRLRRTSKASIREDLALERPKHRAHRPRRRHAHGRGRGACAEGALCCSQSRRGRTAGVVHPEWRGVQASG